MQMDPISAIILIVMPSTVVVSFIVLFMEVKKSKKENLVYVPQYKASFNKILERKNYLTPISDPPPTEDQIKRAQELAAIGSNHETFGIESYIRTYGEVLNNTFRYLDGYPEEKNSAQVKHGRTVRMDRKVKIRQMPDFYFEVLDIAATFTTFIKLPGTLSSDTNPLPSSFNSYDPSYLPPATS